MAYSAPGSNIPDDQDAADALGGHPKSRPAKLHSAFQNSMNEEELDEELEDEGYDGE